jgi:hypothetical protein
MDDLIDSKVRFYLDEMGVQQLLNDSINTEEYENQ